MILGSYNCNGTALKVEKGVVILDYHLMTIN